MLAKHLVFPLQSDSIASVNCPFSAQGAGLVGIQVGNKRRCLSGSASRAEQSGYGSSAERVSLRGCAEGGFIPRVVCSASVFETRLNDPIELGSVI